MRRYLSFISILLLLTDCHPIGRQFITQVDPALFPFYQAFSREAELRRRYLPQRDFYMGFGDLSSLGSCTLWPNIAVVLINRPSWASLTLPEQEQLTFHELGHCILGRGHRTELVQQPDGVLTPASIMNAFLFDGEFLLDYHDYYMSELFK